MCFCFLLAESISLFTFSKTETYVACCLAVFMPREHDIREH